MEHEPPRVFKNMMSEKEIRDQSVLVHQLWQRKVKTAEIHKAIQTTDKRLGCSGKAVVSGQGLFLGFFAMYIEHRA